MWLFIFQNLNSRFRKLTMLQSIGLGFKKILRLKGSLSQYTFFGSEPCFTIISAMKSATAALITDSDIRCVASLNTGGYVI